MDSIGLRPIVVSPAVPRRDAAPYTRENLNLEARARIHEPMQILTQQSIRDVAAFPTR